MRYIMKRVGIHILALAIARCGIGDMYPFVVPFFGAAVMKGKDVGSIFVVMLLGLFSSGMKGDICKYGTIFFLMWIVYYLGKKTDKWRGREAYIFAIGVICFVVGIVFVNLKGSLELWNRTVMIESVAAIVLVTVFCEGLDGIYGGANHRFSTPVKMIGMYLSIACLLIGSINVTEYMNLPLFIGIFLLLYFSRVYEGKFVVLLGTLVGVVLCYDSKEVQWIGVLVILSCLLVALRDFHPLIVVLAGGILLVVLGVTFLPMLLGWNHVIAGILAVALFMLIPRRLLKQVIQSNGVSLQYNQNSLAWDMLREQIIEFGQMFIDLELLLGEVMVDEGQMLPVGLSNIYLSGDGISLLNVMESQSNRLTSLRKGILHQYGEIGEVITAYARSFEYAGIEGAQFEALLMEQGLGHGISIKNAILVKNRARGKQVYLSGCNQGKNVIATKMLSKWIGSLIGKEMICLEGEEELLTKKEQHFSFIEAPKYYITIGTNSRNKQGESVCGDSNHLFKISSQKAILMLSDGMGCGALARNRSSQVIELMSRMLEAGFQKELAIDMMNGYVSFAAGGSGSTSLDLTVVDLYEGEVDFVKLGASTTFVRRRDTVECISSTSLPVGVMEEVEFDTCQRSLYDGDMIIMISDGVIDNLTGEQKEKYLADYIAGAETKNPQELADGIMNLVSREKDGFKDDSSVIVASLWKRA